MAILEHRRGSLSAISDVPTGRVSFAYHRKASHDDLRYVSRKYLLAVDRMKSELLAREDTDRNDQISIDDHGPKTFPVSTVSSLGYRKHDIRGQYSLSNLLQELTLAQEDGLRALVLDQSALDENPVTRLSKFIRDMFWDRLTRRIDGSVIERVGIDPKDWTPDPRPRIYVPHGAPEQYEYYNQLAAQRPELRLEVSMLPRDLSLDAVRSLNDKPGLLAIEMEEVSKNTDSQASNMRGLPFIVPGGRFNELYGWDSYMESLGLLADGRVHLAKSMVLHFCFCIKHYGMILNANRSYYLCRSQPPFLTDMALNVYRRIESEPGSQEFLRSAILAAIKEYYTVWMTFPRYDSKTGLSRYRPTPLGIPLETEPTHFAHVLRPYCSKYNLELAQFIEAYNNGRIQEPDLANYLLHDCAVRESGHDTSFRLENVCADLATIDLNALLYKYEIDIAHAIQSVFGGQLPIPTEFCAGDMNPNIVETPERWNTRAQERLKSVNRYLWNQERGMYLDYNTKTEQQTVYPAATTFWPLWCGLASPDQAALLISRALPLFEAFGGITAGTEDCRSLNEPPRQWDFPSGWAPHQILLWNGLLRYDYRTIAERLAYKWLYTMTKVFADFNGAVVEKYDVTNPVAPHRVNAEYGNQGVDFRGVNKEGFGWVNASFVCGLKVIPRHMVRAIGALVPYDDFNKATKHSPS